MRNLSPQKITTRRFRSAGLIVTLIAMLALIYALVLSMPTRVYEASDFLGYWASASLLAHRQNPYDQIAVQSLEQEQGWAGDSPVYSWNPPWLHVLLLPLGLLPFRPAAALWFVAGPLLIGASAILIWDTFAPRGRPVQVALALSATFLFSRSLHAILEGQVNTLILLGCAAFIALSFRNRDALAGAALVLATVKPHVSYLLVPGALLVSALRGRWRIISGFLASLILLVVVATCLFPQWVEAYLHLFDVAASPLGTTGYMTPTVRGLLRAGAGLDIGIWPSVVCLAVFLVLLWLRGREFSLSAIVGVSLIIGLPTAPFGWSTDQVVLIIPILQSVIWSLDLPVPQRRAVAASLLLIYAYAILVWLVSYRDVAFVVVPPMIGLVWGYTYSKASPGSLTTIGIRSGRQHPAED